MPDYRGQCLCGAVRYRVTADAPAAMFLCHCSRCRQESGSSHAATVFLGQAELDWERGGVNLTAFALAGTRKSRAFCTTCGSPMPRREAGGVVLPAGSLDDDCCVHPTAHIFCASAAGWEAEAATVPRFDGLPPAPAAGSGA